MTTRRPWVLIIVAVVCALIWAAFLGQRHYAGLSNPLDRLETSTVDLRTLAFGVRDVPSDLVIVAIDDEAVSEAGGFPLDRRRLAALISRIHASGGRALGVDLLLLDPTAADADLIEALGLMPTVLAGVGQFDSRIAQDSVVPQPQSLLLPQRVFASVADTGLVNVATDVGGTPRHFPMVFRTDQGPMPSFALRAVGLFGDQTVSIGPDGVRAGEFVQPLDLGWNLALRFYGPRGTIPTISASGLLAEGAGDARLEGKLVIVGATATGIGDRFNSPFDRILPGVEVLATGIANLLDHSGLIRNERVRGIDAFAAGTLVLIAICALACFPLALGSIIYTACLGMWLVAITALFSQGYWFSMTLPLAVSLPPFAGFLLVSQVLERRESHRRFIAGQELGRFQAPALAARIASDPTFLTSPTAQNAAILFVDLSGFSGVSERLGASATRDLLKAFHTQIAETVAANNGLVLDYMGDGAMIGFGIIGGQDQSPRNALLATHQVVKNVRDWILHSEWRDEPLDIRAGVHWGGIVLSRLGHQSQQQIAATGDCVNVASRLMEVAKSNGAVIAASLELVERAGLDGSDIPQPADIRHVEIRGRSGALDVCFW